MQTQFAVIAVKDGITNVDMNLKATILYQENDVDSLNVDLEKFQVFQVSLTTTLEPICEQQ